MHSDNFFKRQNNSQNKNNLKRVFWASLIHLLLLHSMLNEPFWLAHVGWKFAWQCFLFLANFYLLFFFRQLIFSCFNRAACDRNLIPFWKSSIQSAAFLCELYFSMWFSLSSYPIWILVNIWYSTSLLHKNFSFSALI